MAPLTAVATIKHYNIKTIAHFSVMMAMNYKPTSQHWYLTVDTSYTNTCMVECEDDYNRLGDLLQYSCGLNGAGVAWLFNGSGVTCSPGKVVG